METGFAELHPPPSSPPKLAVEDLPAERPIFGRLFAIGEGGSCVSAHRSRLLGTFLGRLSPGAKIPFPPASWWTHSGLKSRSSHLGLRAGGKFDQWVA